jgi:hypothetical protein
MKEAAKLRVEKHFSNQAFADNLIGVIRGMDRPAGELKLE